MVFSDNNIVDFSNFCVQVHEIVECKREDCKVKIFAIDCLNGFLKKDKIHEERREFFISLCKTFKKTFI